jgi:hypothetical protein
MKKLLLALILLLAPSVTWAQGLPLKDGNSSVLLEIDTVSQAARVSNYDTSGNALTPADKGAIGALSGGVALSGKDYKLGRSLRASPSGALAIADEQIVMLDNFPGTARNLAVWVETATTQASAQTLAVGLTLNSAATLTTATGILESSARQVQFTSRSPVVVRFHLNFKGATNCFEEWGFSDQTSATVALHNNGAFFRRDGAGSVQPVIAFNGGAEAQGTVMTAPATTEYGWYEVFLEDGRATFSIYSHTGTLLSTQTMEIGTAGAGAAGDPTRPRFFAVSHLPVMMRTINTGAAGTAPQILVNHVAAYSLDLATGKPWGHTMSGLGFNSSILPSTFLQAATWANSANPAGVALANTTCAVATLGGLINTNAIAGATTTDLCLVGWTNPSPYTFYFTGLRIGPPQNLIAAVATTVTNFTTFGMAFNSSAVSLATAGTYPPIRVAVGGVFKCPVALAVGDSCTGSDISWDPITPIAVYPGKFLHLIVRVPIGTATATETFLWNVGINGYFE